MSDGWRPIETAPRDGSYILVFASGENEYHERIDIAAFCSAKMIRKSNGYKRGEYGWEECKNGEWGNDTCGVLEDITHWMPLPPEPK